VAADRPWAHAVVPREQASANELMQQGNALLKDSFFAQAVGKYKESLQHWDHPATHYNLALALLSLDEPLVTYEHLKKSVAFGPEPLGQDKFEYAEKYLALLAHQVVSIRVSCEEPGATVRLDGQILFRAPGNYAGLVRRGDHSFAASKPGFETTELNRTLEADKPFELALKLYQPAELEVFDRNYPVWIPVSVTTLGALTMGAGAGALFLSQDSYDQFDQAIASNPDCSFGCTPPDSAQVKLDEGDMLQTLGIVGLTAGGATLAAGITLWIFDGSSRRMSPEEKGKFAMTPLLGPGTVGFVGTGHF